MTALADDLRKIVKGEVDDSKDALEKASRDASLYRVMPQVVVRPSDAEDIEKTVRFASEKKQVGEDISITARSAGTDMSGGPLNTGIILDMTAHLNRLHEIGTEYAVVEPGMYFRDFDRETQKKGLELPSYTASREICTVGGMAANDSGGEKNLKFGKTDRYVEALDVVMSDGETHTLKNLSGEALQTKLKEESFEGELYRKIAALLKKNRMLIESAKPSVSKNSSGYHVWDIGDGETSLNLARLMVGAQGTLGIITKIKYKLVKPKPYASMLVMFLKDLKDLGVVVPEVLKHAPDSFESFDDKTFSLAIKYFPEFAAQMKANMFALGLSLLPELWMLATGGVPKLVLIVEFRSDTQAEALSKARALMADIEKKNLHEKMYVAETAAEAKKFWVIRRESFNLLRKKVRGMRTAPFIDDFVVPPAVLPEFLPKLQGILSKYDLVYTVAGHVGDGNFHIIPLVNPKRPELPQIIEELSQKVYDLVLSYKGSITGEHNDGLVRTPYVEKMFGPEMYRLFEEVKRIFDPQGIFNPGKKTGTDLAASAARLDLGR